MVYLGGHFTFLQGRGMLIKAVGFDFVETLVHVSVNHELCMKNLVESLRAEGIRFSPDDFSLNYSAVIHKYRHVREVLYKEVSNETWVSEALGLLGHSVDSGSEVVKRAVDAYFQPYIDSLTLSPGTLVTLSKVHRRFSTGLISNFTVARVIHKCLERLGLTRLLDRVIVSEEIVWRKPHPNIFKELVRSLNVEPEEAVFVGDSLVHDVYGAKNSGLRAVWIVGGSNSMMEHPVTCFDVKKIEPDFRISSICEVLDILDEIA